MNVDAGWIVLGIGLAVALVVLATSWLWRGHDRDLGQVSDQWMAEQRMRRGEDPQR